MTAKRLVRTLIWPARRFFDPRFGGVYGGINAILERLQQAVARQEETSRSMEAVQESMAALRTEFAQSVEAHLGSLAYVGQEIERRTESADRLTGIVEEIQGLLTRIEDRGVGLLGIGGQVEDLDAAAANALNYAEGHTGYKAQRDLWFNPPVNVTYMPGDVRVASVTERIVEVPYVFRALGRIAPGARVLDVGSSESLVSLSLAAMGHAVTALDLRRYPVGHPNLVAVASPLEEWTPSEEPFDAAICLSSIEHFGLGAYGEPPGPDDADLRALARVQRLTRPGGLLVLTVPYGLQRRFATQRVYDAAGLDRLLRGWEVEERVIVAQHDDVVWLPVGDGASHSSELPAVAMVTARRPSEDS